MPVILSKPGATSMRVCGVPIRAALDFVHREGQDLHFVFLRKPPRHVTMEGHAQNAGTETRMFAFEFDKVTDL